MIWQITFVDQEDPAAMRSYVQDQIAMVATFQDLDREQRRALIRFIANDRYLKILVHAERGPRTMEDSHGNQPRRRVARVPEDDG